MNNGQGRGRGHGLIRTGPDARTWNYGSEGWGNSPRLASWYPLDLLRPSARAAVLTSTVRGSASSSARVIPLLICLFGCTRWSSGTASALEVSAAFGFPVTLPSRLPKDGRRCLGSSSGLGERGLPSGAVGDSMQQPPRVLHMVRVRWARRVPRRTEPGQLPEHRACSRASPCGRPGDQPASCRTTCGTPGPAARRSRGDRRHAPCPCSSPAPGPAGRPWAGCRTAASSRTAASTAAIAALPPALRCERAGRRSGPGGSRPPAW